MNEAPFDFDENVSGAGQATVGLEHTTDQTNITRRLKYIGLNALTFAAVSPLNEVVRFSAFAAAESYNHSPVAGALAFGVSTLGVEVAGALAISPLLETESSNKAISFINQRLARVGVKDGTTLSGITKLNVLFFGGSAARIFVEQREDTTRTREQNIRLGLVGSIELAGLCAIQGALMSEGINLGLDNPAKVGGLAVGITAAAGLWRKIRSDLKLKDYYSHMKLDGPQQEGIEPLNFKRALHDKLSVKERIYSKEKLPVLVPMHYASWLNPDFFVKKGYEPNDLAYSIIPQNSYAEFDQKTIKQIFKNAYSKGYKGIIFDYYEDSEVFEKLVTKENVDELITSDGTPAQVFHYHAKLHANPQAFEKYKPDKNVISIDQSDLDLFFTQIWDIYDSRFQELVDDHPIRGQLSQKELHEVLSAEGCYLKAYIDDDRKIQSFGYLISDLKLCPWLNKEFFKEKSDGDQTVYFSGIASAKTSSRMTSFSLINAFTHQLAQKWPESNLTFECSNKSAKYIPRIVKKSFEVGGMCKLEDMTERRYHYKVIKLTDDIA